MRNVFNKIVCVIMGHEWKYLRYGARFKGWLHSTMHSDCDCIRCGKQIRDAAREENK